MSLGRLALGINNRFWLMCSGQDWLLELLWDRRTSDASACWGYRALLCMGGLGLPVLLLLVASPHMDNGKYDQGLLESNSFPCSTQHRAIMTVELVPISDISPKSGLVRANLLLC